MATAMAATVSTTLPPTSSSCSLTRPSVISCSALVIPRPRCPRCPRLHLLVSIPQEGFRHLCPWNGLKHLGISCRHRSRGGKERYMGRVYASLFGVGAPEALVIGVVALLVFGPKGLAEVARTLGKTLRSFQPTIRELQEVSREFKNTLEREIGLDESPPSTNNSTYQSSSFTNEDPPATVDPNGTPSTRRPYTSEELVRLTREQLAASQAAPQAQETDLEDQPQGAPDASSSPEASNTTSTSETAGSTSATEVSTTSTSENTASTSASEVTAQMTLVENPENEGSKS